MSAKRTSIDERLRCLREIRDEGDLEKVREASVKYLSDGCHLVVAEAATLVLQFELAGTEAALLAAWDRLVKHADPDKADRGCTAKAAIIEALGCVKFRIWGWRSSVLL